MPDPVATQAASPAAPATPASTPSTPAAATPAAPAQAATPPTQSPTPQPQATGEPPKERWPDILENARRKTREEIEAIYQQRYGAFERDPWGAIQQWIEEASQHSVYGPMINQWAEGRFQPKQQPLGEEPQPDVPIVDQQGNVTGHTYSAKQLKEWHKWNQTQQQQALDQRFGKLEQHAQQQEELAVRAKAWSDTQQTLTSFRKLPFFSENEADIRQALADHEEWGDNLHAAYNHVLVTKVLPTLSQTEQAAALKQLNDKAVGNTISPSSQHVAAKPQFKTFREAAEYYSKHPEEAAAAANRG